MLTPADLDAAASFNAQMVRATAAVQASVAAQFEAARASILLLLEAIRTGMNTPSVVAAMEGRYVVRAALDPAYRTPEALNALVHRIMAGDEDAAEGTWLLTRESRAVVAAAAIRGWSSTHPAELPPHGLAWSRMLGSTAVHVTREVAS